MVVGYLFLIVPPFKNPDLMAAALSMFYKSAVCSQDLRLCCVFLRGFRLLRFGSCILVDFYKCLFS